jgi:hypothetical protein
MREKAEEVLAGLKVHAVGRGNALRASGLAAKLGLPRKIVSNALNSLTESGSRNSEVRRERLSGGNWFEYWIEL